MNRILIGLALVLLDWKLTLGTVVFELLPDFVGFFLVMKGMEGLREETVWFDRGRHVAFALMLASLVLYGGNLMNPDAMTRVLLWGLELGVICGKLWLLRQVLKGCEDFRKDNGPETAKGMLPVLAAVRLVGHLVGWIPLVGEIAEIAAIVVALIFLAALWKGIRK